MIYNRWTLLQSSTMYYKVVQCRKWTTTKEKHAQEGRKRCGELGSRV